MFLLTSFITLCYCTSLTQADLRAASGGLSLEQVLVNERHFVQITDLLRTSGLLSQLSNVTAFPNLTLYLPDDAAVSAAPPDLLSNLNSDPALLLSVLKFHVVNHDVIKMTHANDVILDTMALQPLRLNYYKLPDVYAAEGVPVVNKNIAIENGYVHVLSGFLIPPEGNIPYVISQRPDMRILNSLIQVAGLGDMIKNDQNMTFFAPTDTAFSKMTNDAQKFLMSNPEQLKEVLLYHIIDRQTLYSVGMVHSMTFPTADQKHDRVMVMGDGAGHIFLNGGLLSEVDISATNGVLHVMDHVMIPVRVLLEMEGQGITVIG